MSYRATTASGVKASAAPRGLGLDASARRRRKIADRLRETECPRRGVPYSRQGWTPDGRNRIRLRFTTGETPK
jgi:hypothetical protein